MYNITLLSSFHKHLGKCNPDELYKIIEEIQPEIIFEELSYSTFQFVYANGYNPESLEAFTIKKYLNKYPIKHFPVDTYPINETDLFNGADLIANKSNEYANLWQEQVSMIGQNGYSFLNNNECIKLLDKIRIIEESTLLEINNTTLSSTHKSESILHDKRENEMLQNIYNYSKQFVYNKALFICGVDHRNALIKKIQEFENKENLKLKWTIYNGIQAQSH